MSRSAVPFVFAVAAVSICLFTAQRSFCLFCCSRFIGWPIPPFVPLLPLVLAGPCRFKGPVRAANVFLLQWQHLFKGTLPLKLCLILVVPLVKLELISVWYLLILTSAIPSDLTFCLPPFLTFCYNLV